MRGWLTRSALAGFALAVAIALPAAAHGELVATSPPANAVLLEAPEKLTLTFGESVDLVTASIDLFDEQRQPVPAVGTPTADTLSTTLTVPLPPLPPSLYTVSYRVTSAIDGHVVSGSWVFLVDPTGTRPLPTTVSENESPSSAPALVAARWAALVGGLLLLGTALFWLATARLAIRDAGSVGHAADAVPPWGALTALGLLSFVALAVYLALAAQPFVADGATPGGFPLDFAAPFGGTPFAWAMRLALGGAAAGTLLAGRRFAAQALARRRGSEPRAGGTAMLALVGAAAASLAGSSLAGHASALGGPLPAAIDWLHLVAVAAWIGGLPALLAFIRRGSSGRGPLAAAALRRHSRVAQVAAPLVVLSGVANSPLVLGDARALAASDYGNLVIAKALLFSVAVAIGAANFFLGRAGAPWRAARLMAAEVGVGALAVAVAAVLVTGQPAAGRPSELARSPIGVAQLSGAANGLALRVAANLPSPGVQRYQVSVADAMTGAFRRDVHEVHAVFTPPVGSDLQPRRVTLGQSADPWLWGSTGEFTPVVGSWTVTVEVRAGEDAAVSVELDLEVVAARPAELVPPAASGIGIPAPLALLWGLMPAGAAGWLVPFALLSAIAWLSWLVRQRPGAAPGLRRAALGAAALFVVLGLAVAARSAWSAANAPPASARAEINPIAATAASVERGRTLYLANCSSCHAAGGAGDGPAAGGMLPGPGDLAVSVPPESDGGLAYRIAIGIAGTAMPPFTDTLSLADRWDLVNYLRSAWPGTED